MKQEEKAEPAERQARLNSLIKERLHTKLKTLVAQQRCTIREWIERKIEEEELVFAPELKAQKAKVKRL